MIGNALEQEIIDLYSSNPSSLYSINQIANKLGKKYPYINKKVTILIKNNIFKKTIVGRSHLCSLNLNNDETTYLLILNEIKKKKKAFEDNPKSAKILDYSLKIARASNTSLIIKINDKIIFVVEKKDEKDYVKKSIITQAFSGIKIEVLSKEEFLEQLQENITMQKNHTILSGFEKYYDYIREIEDELKIKYSRIIP